MNFNKKVKILLLIVYIWGIVLPNRSYANEIVKSSNSIDEETTETSSNKPEDEIIEANASNSSSKANTSEEKSEQSDEEKQLEEAWLWMNSKVFTDDTHSTLKATC